MVKKIITFILMVALLSSFVVAQDSLASKIRVKSLADTTVYLSVVDPSNSDFLYDMSLKRTDQYGDAYFSYISNDSSKFEFDLKIKVMDGKVQIYPSSDTSIFGTYNIGEDIFVEAYEDYQNVIPTPGLDDVVEEVIEELVEVINDTDTLIEEVVEIVNSEDLEDGNESVSWFTGHSIAEFINSPVGYGGIGGVFILIILGIFLFSRRRKKSNVGKVSSSHSSVSKSISGDELSSAEAKLKAVQAEIQRLKGQDKVSEVRKRIAAEEEELRKLRSGRI